MLFIWQLDVDVLLLIQVQLLLLLLLLLLCFNLLSATSAVLQQLLWLLALLLTERVQ
jgi:hypothetical protein